MSFRQLTHHPTPFRSIRAACDGGGAASAQDSAREPERESAQEPEREAAEEEEAAAAEEAAEEEEAAAAEEAAAEAAEEAVWAPHGTRYMVLLPTPGDAAKAERVARRHRSSEAGRRRPSRRTRRRKEAAPSRRTWPLCASSSRA
jgi:colicin import membrane protein